MATAFKTRDWESAFHSWAQSLGKFEDEKASRAITAIERAVASNASLQEAAVTTFVQGSYKNGTGVRQESDVDVCIRNASVFHFELPIGFSPQAAGFSLTTNSYEAYRSEVHRALAAEFGLAVKPGNKAFNIRENTYRVEADVVACWEYRLYFVGDKGLLFHRGTSLVTRDGKLITNFPDQQFDMGNWKDSQTGGRFKPTVRMMKKLTCEMVEANIPAAKRMKSFLIESLVWNLGSHLFFGATLKEIVLGILTTIELEMAYGGGANWMEENGIKSLFGSGQEWSSAEVLSFATAAKAYIASH